MIRTRRKLIEVALPLEAINVAAAREKSIRHGHPSTLHLWWARRPLAAARAVIFAQMVDDPAEHPEWYPTKGEQDAERERLFRLIEELVLWENTTNEQVLSRARAEILKSWRSTCEDNKDHAQAKELFNPERLPGFHDPFAGGGALPLEAQRLGLEAVASDLNPVAVLINKAMIEIPPKFAGQAPVNPVTRGDNQWVKQAWNGVMGMAEDIRYYGQWMRDEAEQRIGSLYPKVKVTPQMVEDRPDLAKYQGSELPVIAWIWARTVNSPNPAFAHVRVPLTSSFQLSTKKGKEAYIEATVDGDGYRFDVKSGRPTDLVKANKGTKSGGSHSNFLCIMSGAPIEFESLRQAGRDGLLGSRLMAIVAEGERERVYLSPSAQEPSSIPRTVLRPEAEISHWPGRTNVVEYGMTTFGDLFTDRQLVALNTFSDLVGEARKKVLEDAIAAGMADDGKSLDEGGRGATAYADALATFLAFAVDRQADYSSSLCGWISGGETLRNTFGRQALPMVWDFCEANVLSTTTGGFFNALKWVWGFLGTVPAKPECFATQADAQTQDLSRNRVISTDPPYYDNIGYADLSDFFYVWIRRSLRDVYPKLLATVSVPKAEELVATPYRHGGKDNAESFFMSGMTEAMSRLATRAHPVMPVTIYYAFKQSEINNAQEATSTGWETFLNAVIQSGFEITGTWPLRTERSTRLVGQNASMLASSILLVCRKRADDARTITRREFDNILRVELPQAIKVLQSGNVAPVDLAQASIGPGMAIYTRFAKILSASGEPLSVGEALARINAVLDEALAEQEGDFDSDTRWALTWFEQYGFETADFGEADNLARAKNTSVNGLVEAGLIWSKAGKARLLKPEELQEDWDPSKDTRLTVWEMVHQLIRTMDRDGEGAAARLVKKLGAQADVARELAYRLYNLCERKKRAPEAIAYNGLVVAWPELTKLAASSGPQTELLWDGAYWEHIES